MAEFDEIIKESGVAGNERRNSYSKEEYAAAKKEEREALFGARDRMMKEISDDPESFTEYLDIQSRFPKMSPNNIMLIMDQDSGATELRTFEEWAEMKTPVNKGEKAISLFSPGHEYTRDDGTTFFSTEIRKVFDISQTSSGQEALVTEPYSQKESIRSVINIMGYDVCLANDNSSPDLAWFDPERNVYLVSPGLKGNEIFSSLVYELAMEDKRGRVITEKDEFAAYCISYIASVRYGFETTQYDFSRVPEYFSEKSPEEIRDELTGIRNKSSDLIHSIRKEAERINEKQIGNIEKGTER